MLQLDERIGGRPLWRITPEWENLMLVPDEVRKCVCFLGFDAPEGRRLAGTGFFMSVDSKTVPSRHYNYLVTAKHIIKGIEGKSNNKVVYARLNNKINSFDWAPNGTGQWFCHDDPYVDIAVLPVSPALFDNFDCLVFPSESSLTDENIKRKGLVLAMRLSQLAFSPNIMGNKETF